ncbi:MAG TPA: hypothetical protein V6D17_21165 [Candidatus Obscuribacterales bacterium]
MGKKAETFYSDSLTHELVEAVNNDFGKAVLKLPNQGRGEVRDEVFVYFSAVAMQQVNALSLKHGIEDPDALHELYQFTRANLIHGFRLGQNMKGAWLPS